MKIYALQLDGYECQYFDEEYLRKMLAAEAESRDFIWWLNHYYTPHEVYEEFYNSGYEMALLYFEKKFIEFSFQNYLAEEGFELVINDEENYYND